MKRCQFALILLVAWSAGPVAATARIRWEELPLADPGRRAELVESVVRQLPAHWDEAAGGLAPGAGGIPSFRGTAYGLLALYEAPEDLITELGIPREQWLRDAMTKMAQSQVLDQSQADATLYPKALYGTILYPGWLPESEWPWPRSVYEWDMFTPPPLLTLLARHGPTLPADVRELLGSMLWTAADGALKTWYAVRFLEEADGSEEYWGHTNYTLMYIQTLVLGGELAGHPQALTAGVEALDRWLADLRRRGVHEYASPTYAAVDLDALGHLAQEAQDSEVRRMATAAWLYLWTDMALTLTETGDDLLSMGGPASRTYTPLTPGGGHLAHLFLAGINSEPPGLDPVNGYRGTLERRPPPAVVGLASPGGPREAAACWGDAAGQDRSWRVEPGLMMGVASARYGRQDRGLAVDLAPPAARVHLSADRLDGSGGLPSGAGTGHNLLLYSAARSGRSLAAIAEAHPAGQEESTTMMLFLPAEVESATTDEADLLLPPPGVEQTWVLSSGRWVAVATADWWLAAAALSGTVTPAVLRAAADPAHGVRVLRLEVHGGHVNQPVVAGWVIAAVPRASVPDSAALRELLAATRTELVPVAGGLQLEARGGVVEGELRVVHDLASHGLVSRSPEPPAVCGVGRPLQAPGLEWEGPRLKVSSGADELVIDLSGSAAPRAASGRVTQ